MIPARHAQYVSWVAGLATKNGLDVRPILDDAGNWTDRLECFLRPYLLGPRVVVTLVVPPPLEDWSP